MLPCPHCSCHIAELEKVCPHCEGTVRSESKLNPTAAAVLLGLTASLPGCTLFNDNQSDYGSGSYSSTDWTTTYPEETGDTAAVTDELNEPGK